MSRSVRWTRRRGRSWAICCSICGTPTDLEEAIALSDRVVIRSAGPASRIIGDWKVKLPRPRDIAEVKIEPAFQELQREIWAKLKAEVLRGLGEPARRHQKLRAADV